MSASEPSYTLRGYLGTIPALRDDAGRKYDWVPCMEFPHAWDEDSPISVRRNAARACLTICPALKPCDQNRLELLDATGDNQARGVWAGHIMTKKGEADASDETAAPPAPRRRRAIPSSPVTQPLPDSVTIVYAEATTMGQGPGTCRHCRKPVLWVLTAKGESQPVDPDPNERGLIGVWQSTVTALWCGRYLPPEQPERTGESRHMMHAATCTMQPPPKRQPRRQDAPLQRAADTGRTVPAGTPLDIPLPPGVVRLPRRRDEPVQS